MRLLSWGFVGILGGIGLRLLTVLAGYLGMYAVGSLPDRLEGFGAIILGTVTIPLLAVIYSLPAFASGVLVGAWKRGPTAWRAVGLLVLGLFAGAALVEWFFFDPVPPGIQLSAQELQAQFFSEFWSVMRYDLLVIVALILGTALSLSRSVSDSRTT